MNEDQLTAHTIREALAAGTALARRFRLYAGPMLLYLLLIFVVNAIVRVVSAWEESEVIATVAVLLWTSILAIVSIGVYRGFWDGMHGQPVRARHLLWGFEKSSRWMLPVGAAMVTALPTFSMVRTTVHTEHPALHLPSLSQLPLVILFVLFGIVCVYASCAIARFDVGPMAALRMALGIFQKGRRRWIALPFVMILMVILVMGGAAMIIGLLAALIMKVWQVFSLPKGPLLTLVFVLVGAFLTPIPVLLLAMFPWLSGAYLAALGDFADADSQGMDGVNPTAARGPLPQ